MSVQCHLSFGIITCGQQGLFENDDTQRNSEDIISVIVSTVPADGLAPVGARPSAGTGMTKFEFTIYIWPALIISL